MVIPAKKKNGIPKNGIMKGIQFSSRYGLIRTGATHFNIN